MIKSFVSALSGAAVVYLLGSFAAASFDISTWPSDGRAMCAIYMAMAGAGAGFLTHSIGRTK